MPFDALHVWTMALPAPETLEFQRGKLDALQKLLPYTRDGSREAASVVLKLDGSEFDFAVGDEDSVDSRIPANQAVAQLHTHSEEWAQSEVDWSSFLRVASVEQSHVVTPLHTYSLHKPEGWKALAMENNSAIIARYFSFYSNIVALSPAWSPAKDTIWTCETTRLMARHYGILFREGTRT